MAFSPSTSEVYRARIWRSRRDSAPTAATTRPAVMTKPPAARGPPSGRRTATTNVMAITAATASGMATRCPNTTTVTAITVTATSSVDASVRGSSSATQVQMAMSTKGIDTGGRFHRRYRTWWKAESSRPAVRMNTATT